MGLGFNKSQDQVDVEIDEGFGDIEADVLEVDNNAEVEEVICLPTLEDSDLEEVHKLKLR